MHVAAGNRRGSFARLAGTLLPGALPCRSTSISLGTSLLPGLLPVSLFTLKFGICSSCALATCLKTKKQLRPLHYPHHGGKQCQ